MGLQWVFTSPARSVSRCQCTTCRWLGGWAVGWWWVRAWGALCRCGLDCQAVVPAAITLLLLSSYSSGSPSAPTAPSPARLLLPPADVGGHTRHLRVRLLCSGTDPVQLPGEQASSGGVGVEVCSTLKDSAMQYHAVSCSTLHPCTLTAAVAAAMCEPGGAAASAPAPAHSRPAKRSHARSAAGPCSTASAAAIHVPAAAGAGGWLHATPGSSGGSSGQHAAGWPWWVWERLAGRWLQSAAALQ